MGFTKRVGQVVALTGLMTMVAAAITEAPAVAASPQPMHIHFNQLLPGIPVCGLTVDSFLQVTDTFETFIDQLGNVTIHDQSHVVSTLINEANGKVVTVATAGRDSYQPDPVVNRDGTITATDTITGTVQIYTSHSSTLVRDAGSISTVDTFDAQLNFVSEQVIVHGPHPFGGDQTVMCDAITSAIG